VVTQGAQSAKIDVDQDQEVFNELEGGSQLTFRTSPNDQDMKQLLTDVTGAKPSMIKVTSKTDKAGSAYFDFSTPLGDGEFWQQKPSNLRDVAEDYISDYKKDCKAGFEPNESDAQKGQKGDVLVATAACSDSPYQNDGPEFVTYVFMQSDSVISIFNTYVGGNAAKAKTDSLGELIGNHVRDMTQQP
jgi:hypothetical protein